MAWKPVIKYVAIKRTSIIIIWKIKVRNTIKNQQLSKINILGQLKKTEATGKTNYHLIINGTHTHC